METEIIAPLVLRKYVWELLKANTDMTETDYTLDPDNNPGLVPIVPLSEEPEISQFDKPYIVYGYSESATDDLYIRKRGNMAFVIYSTNFRELEKITNIISTALDRADESARDVNEYTSTIDAFVGLRFGFIKVSFVEGGSPEDSEGGRQSSAINVRYEYFVDYDIQTSLV